MVRGWGSRRRRTRPAGSSSSHGDPTGHERSPPGSPRRATESKVAARRLRRGVIALALLSLLRQYHTFVRYGLSLTVIELTKPFLPLPEALEHAEFSFPSVEERVRYYMGDYYEDAAPGAAFDTNGEICRDIPIFRAEDGEFSARNSILERPYVFDERALRIMKGRRKHANTYEHDALKYFEYGALDEIGGNETVSSRDISGNRIIFQFGDTPVDGRRHYPIMAKARAAHPPGEGRNVPILAFLNVKRHYGLLRSVRRYHPWKEKRGAVVFRGVSTGNRLEILRPYINASADADLDLAFVKFVQRDLDPETRSSLRGGWLSAEQSTGYKYLLVLPGNDVSSGLKWMLYSDSVVFMPRPEIVSWAMEDRLVPYVHYVPVREDLADLRERLEWARANDELCRNISRHATKYMVDLYASEKARRENEEVRRLISQRYWRLYGPALSTCS